MRRSTSRRAVVAGFVTVAATAVPSLAAAESGPQVHVVRAGDTLTSIGARYGVSVVQLAAVNKLANPNHLLVGQRIQLRSGAIVGSSGASVTTTASSTATTRVQVRSIGNWKVRVPITQPATVHRVVKGETWSSIARKYTTSAGTLASANGRSTTSKLKAGEWLRLPAGAMAFASLPDKLKSSPSRLQLSSEFDRWAATYDIPVDLFKAMAWMESGWQNHVVSKDGAVGIGQLMPVTTKWVNEFMIAGRDLNPKVAAENIRLSARYLAYLLAVEDGDEVAALADYYQGKYSVDTTGPQRVTRNYVEVIMALKPRFATVT